jgi:hypothetical protein
MILSNLPMPAKSDTTAQSLAKQRLATHAVFNCAVEKYAGTRTIQTSRTQLLAPTVFNAHSRRNFISTAEVTQFWLIAL